MDVGLNQEGTQALPHGQRSESPDYEITVEYLPASHPSHKSYEGNETLATVRADAMNFFHVTTVTATLISSSSNSRAAG